MFEKSFVKNKGDYIIVTPKGSMTGHDTDLVPLDEYRNVVADHIVDCQETGKKPNVIFDLSRVSYMSSTAISILVKNHITIKRRSGKFILTNINESIRKIFVITKLDSVFKVTDSLEEAEKEMQGA